MSTKMPKPPLEMIRAEAQAFHHRFTTVMLATVSEEGHPHASYAPYIQDTEGSFWVFLSELARHTPNLLHCPRASLLFLEDEPDMQQAFARKRITYEGRVIEIAREDPLFGPRLDRMAERQGPIIGVLRTLKDFHLFKIVPERAIYVRGFGEAFTLEGSDLEGIDWIRDRGHRPDPS